MTIRTARNHKFKMSRKHRKAIENRLVLNGDHSRHDARIGADQILRFIRSKNGFLIALNAISEVKTPALIIADLQLPSPLAWPDKDHQINHSTRLSSFTAISPYRLKLRTPTPSFER